MGIIKLFYPERKCCIFAYTISVANSSYALEYYINLNLNYSQFSVRKWRFLGFYSYNVFDISHTYINTLRNFEFYCSKHPSVRLNWGVLYKSGFLKWQPSNRNVLKYSYMLGKFVGMRGGGERKMIA